MPGIVLPIFKSSVAKEGALEPQERKSVLGLAQLAPFDRISFFGIPRLILASGGADSSVSYVPLMIPTEEEYEGRSLAPNIDLTGWVELGRVGSGRVTLTRSNPIRPANFDPTRE